MNNYEIEKLFYNSNRQLVVNNKTPLKRIAKLVCDTYQMNVENLISSKRYRKLGWTDARKCFGLFAWEEGYKHEQIGEFLQRDRTTVICLIRAAKELFDTNQEFNKKITKIYNQLYEFEESYKVPIETIVDRVCEVFMVKKTELQSRRHYPELKMARIAICYISRMEDHNPFDIALYLNKSKRFVIDEFKKGEEMVQNVKSTWRKKVDASYQKVFESCIE